MPAPTISTSKCSVVAAAVARTWGWMFMGDCLVSGGGGFQDLKLLNGGGGWGNPGHPDRCSPGFFRLGLSEEFGRLLLVLAEVDQMRLVGGQAGLLEHDRDLHAVRRGSELSGRRSGCRAGQREVMGRWRDRSCRALGVPRFDVRPASCQDAVSLSQDSLSRLVAQKRKLFQRNSSSMRNHEGELPTHFFLQ